MIARAGKPLVKVTALDAPGLRSGLDFLVGEITVPRDFDRMGEREIKGMFEGRG